VDSHVITIAVVRLHGLICKLITCSGSYLNEGSANSRGSMPECKVECSMMKRVWGPLIWSSVLALMVVSVVNMISQWCLFEAAGRLVQLDAGTCKSIPIECTYEPFTQKENNQVAVPTDQWIPFSSGRVAKIDDIHTLETGTENKNIFDLIEEFKTDLKNCTHSRACNASHTADGYVDVTYSVNWSGRILRFQRFFCSCLSCLALVFVCSRKVLFLIGRRLQCCVAGVGDKDDVDLPGEYIVVFPVLLMFSWYMHLICAPLKDHPVWATVCGLCLLVITVVACSYGGYMYVESERNGLISDHVEQHQYNYNALRVCLLCLLFDVWCNFRCGELICASDEFDLAHLVFMCVVSHIIVVVPTLMFKEFEFKEFKTFLCSVLLAVLIIGVFALPIWKHGTIMEISLSVFALCVYPIFFMLPVAKKFSYTRLKTEFRAAVTLT